MLEKNKIYCGDCFDFFPQMEGNSVDYTFTSPPHNRKRNDKYQHYKDQIGDYFGFTKHVLSKLLRVTKGHVFYNIQTNYYNREDIYKIIGEFASYIVDIHIWEKTNPMPASGQSITNAVEYFLILQKDKKPLKSKTTYTKNIISTSVNSNMPKEHKAVMKQDVSDYFVKTFMNGLVFDPFMGVGTTAISCVRAGYRYLGIELHQEYCEIARKRIENVIKPLI